MDRFSGREFRLQVKSLWSKLISKENLVFKSQDSEPGLLDMVVFIGLDRCWRQLLHEDVSILVLRLLFLCILCAVYWRGSFAETYPIIFGRSKFKFDQSCLCNLAVLIATTLVIRLLVGLMYFHFFRNLVWHRDFIGDCILIPLSQVPIIFGFMMNTLIKHFEGRLLHSTILIVILWTGFQMRLSAQDTVIAVLGLLSAICYSKFRSVGCCFLISFTWGFVGFLFFDV